MTTATFSRVQEQFYPADPIESADWEVEIEDIEAEISAIDFHPGWDGDIATVATALHQLQARFDRLVNRYYWDIPVLRIQSVNDAIRAELTAIEITDTVIDDNGATQVVVVGYCNPYLEVAQSDMGDEF